MIALKYKNVGEAKRVKNIMTKYGVEDENSWKPKHYKELIYPRVKIDRIEIEHNKEKKTKK